MESVQTEAATDFTLPQCIFTKHHYTFDHWVDENENTYADTATIPANTYSIGDTVNLNAVFVLSDNAINLTNRECEFDLYANEQIVFNNIPADTAYQVYEETPNGWVLIEQSNVSGIIQPLQTSNASFNNKYQPEVATIQFNGTKTLDGQAVGEGEYTFVLYENDTEIDRKSTLNGGFFQFDIITYTTTGNHTYTIKEVDPQNDKLIWDKHTETITVNVTRDGTNLIATPTYDADGIVFENYTKPGILKITKQTEGQTSANINDVFKFIVQLYNESRPFTEDINWYVE